MTEQYFEELINKYANGEATDEEIQQLGDWYRSFRVADVPWPSSQQSEKELVSRRMLDRLKNEISLQKVSVVNFPWVKVAAALFILVGLATILIHLYQAPTEYITVTNPSGKIQQVHLPDSSMVWLNASTTLHYAKSFRKHRSLKLDGEAYFEVTHDQNNPFQVDAGGIRTTVLGTRFNIKAYGTDVNASVSLISGKVKVADSSRDLALLNPLTQLLFHRKDHASTTVQVDTSNVQAWRHGKLQFQGEPFAAIASALENWYGVKITFSNPAMRGCRYYMSFDNTLPLNKLLAIMAEIAEAQYVFDEAQGTVTLTGKGCQ